MPSKAAFDINARTAILQDFLSGEILFEKEVDSVIYPASMTKIMTSIIARDEPDRLPIVGGRAWGGLIICGYAPIQGGGTKTVEGVASVPYGGTDAADDSGTFRYVSVRYGGRAIAPDNEINGITLAGVGTGTEVSYCEVAYNFDDGFEMFGGTVDLRYCMVYKVGDDAFDTDTGYQGTGQFLVVVRGPNSNRGHEMDGRNSGQAADDSFPKFSNVTIVGNNSGSSEDESLRLREGTAGHFQNYMLVDQQRRGFRATNEDGNLDGTFVVNGSTPPSDDADGRYIWLDPLNVMDDVPTPATVAATDGTDPGANFTFNIQDGNTGVTESNLVPSTEFTGSTPTEASMDASATFVGALTAVFGGLFLSIIFAEFHLRRKGDPIVISIAINILALGLSTYLLRSIFKVSGVFSHPEMEKIPHIQLPIIENVKILDLLIKIVKSVGGF